MGHVVRRNQRTFSTCGIDVRPVDRSHSDMPRGQTPVSEID
jgi:hypothetical protein